MSLLHLATPEDETRLVPLVAALFPVPKIALLPLFVIWFGIDEGSKNALIALGTFTPTVVATNSESTASSIVTGRRSINISVTGRPKRSESPRSPLMTRPK